MELTKSNAKLNKNKGSKGFAAPLILAVVGAFLLFSSTFLYLQGPEAIIDKLEQQVKGANTNYSSVLSLGPSTVTVVPGEILPNLVAISVNANGLSVTGADILINFDNTKLTLLDITNEPNTTFKTFLPLTSNNSFDKTKVIYNANNSGLIQFSVSAFDYSLNNGSPTGKLTGSISPLSNLKFQAKTGVEGTTTISYKFVGLGNTGDSNVIATTNTVTEDVLAKPTSTTIVTITPLTTPPVTPPEDPQQPQNDVTPPFVQITSPVDNIVINKYFMYPFTTIKVSAKDNDSGSGIKNVEFYVNNKLEHTDSTEAYSYLMRMWGRTAGTYTITAKAADQQNNTAESTIRIIVK